MGRFSRRRRRRYRRPTSGPSAAKWLRGAACGESSANLTARLGAYLWTGVRGNQAAQQGHYALPAAAEFLVSGGLRRKHLLTCFAFKRNDAGGGCGEPRVG